MPRTPIDYSKTVIYKIVCNDLTIPDCYVGSTTNFTKRKCQHKFDCKTSNFRIYECIRNNKDWDNWSMLEVEKYPCNDNNEATLRERYWYETLNANLNMVNPNRGKKEYRENNVENILLMQKKYRVENKAKILLTNKAYREENVEKIAIGRKIHYEANRDKILEYHDEYRVNNKEKIKLGKQEFYEANKKQIDAKCKEYSILNAVKLKAKNDVKMQCVCGKEHRYGEKARHIKSKIHQNYLLTLIEV